MTTTQLPSLIQDSGPEVAGGRRAAEAVRRDRPSALQRMVNLTGTLLVVLAVCAVLFFAIGPRFLAYQTATMLTGSMAPEIVPGDVVVTTAQPVSEVAVGDVISYHIPVEDHRVETHRVIEVIRDADGGTAVRTKGDANESVDPWIATLEGDHVYEVSAVIPVVGDVIRTLRSPGISQILMYGVPVVLVGGLLVMIWSPRPRNDDAPAAPPAVETTPTSSRRKRHSPRTVRTTMPQPPVLDRSVLEALGKELANPAGALDFAATFVQMLPARIDAVEAAFDAADTDAAVVALLSLNVSAAMVGARRLEDDSTTALQLVGERSAYSAIVAQLRSGAMEFQSAIGGIIR